MVIVSLSPSDPIRTGWHLAQCWQWRGCLQEHMLGCVHCSPNASKTRRGVAPSIDAHSSYVVLPHPFLGVQAVLRLRNTEMLRIGKEYLGYCHAVRGIAVQSQITLGLDWLRLKFASEEGNGRDITIKKLCRLRRIGG